MNLRTIVSEENLVDVEIFAGVPVIQLANRIGMFEAPYEQFAGLVSDDVALVDFEHGKTKSKGYAFKTLIVVPLVVSQSFTSSYKVNGEKAEVVTRNYVSGAKGRVRLLCLSPQIGETATIYDENGNPSHDEFLPRPFVLTVGGTQGKELFKIIGYGDYANAEIAYDYKMRRGEFKELIATPLTLLVSPDTSKALPNYTFGIPIGFGAAKEVGTGEKAVICPLVGGWNSADLELIASMSEQKPKSPSVPKSASVEKQADIKAKFKTSLAEWREGCLDQIENSELSRMFLGYGQFVAELMGAIGSHKQAVINYDLEQQENPRYQYLEYCAKKQLPQGLTPLEILDNQANGDFEAAFEIIQQSVATEGAPIKFKSPMMITQAVEPLSDVARLQMQLA